MNDLKNYTPLWIVDSVIETEKPIKRFFASLVFSFFITSIVLTIVVVVYLFYSSYKNNFSPASFMVKAAAPINNLKDDKLEIVETSSTKVKPDQNKPDIFGTSMKFTSYEFGITFNYLTNWGYKLNDGEEKSLNVSISKNKNKICLLYDIYKYDENCINGHYIEVLKKDPGKSFKDTLFTSIAKEQINCDIKINKVRGYEIAEIDTQNNSCFGNFSKQNKRVIFQYSPLFPDKFILISINKYEILADTNYNLWEDTISFIN